MSAGIIVGVIIIIVLLALAGTFIALYIVERNKKPKDPGAVSIQGAKFNLKGVPETNPTSYDVDASWDNTAKNNKVTLYASTKPITVSEGGKASSKDTDMKSSQTVDGTTTKSVTISGLIPETTYYLTLIAVNESLSQTVNDTVFTDTVLEGEFTIQDIESKGFIQLVDSNNQYSVTLTKSGDKTTIDDVWEYDRGQFGEPATFTLFSKAVSDTPDVVLYNNKNTLGADNIDNLQPSDYQWVYNPEKAPNQWCLKSDPTQCMSVAKGATTITVATDSTTKWNNIKYTN